VRPWHLDPAFHLRAWLAQGERLADGHGADGRTRDALRAAIAGHVAETRCALGRRARAICNRLLDLMQARRRGITVPHTRASQGAMDGLFGLRISAPEAFRHIDLAHPRFDAIPATLRAEMVRLQENHDLGRADGTVSLDLCRRMERIHPRLPAYAKE